MQDASPKPTLLIVGPATPVLDGLTLVVEAAREAVLRVSHASAARLVLAASPSVTALVCRCTEPGEGPGQTLLEEVAWQHPALALVGVCARTAHTHDGYPDHCHFLQSPFDASDVARALAQARLDAFAWPDVPIP